MGPVGGASVASQAAASSTVAAGVIGSQNVGVGGHDNFQAGGSFNGAGHADILRESLDGSKTMG